MRKCKTCGEDKPLEDYPLGKRYKEGRKPHCLPCFNKRNKESRDPAKEKARVKRWQEDNPEAYLALKRRRRSERRAKIKGASFGILPKGYFRILKDIFGEQCLRCGSKENLELDHIIPLALNGWHCINNFQLLCKSCNNWKSDRIMDFRPFELIYEA